MRPNNKYLQVLHVPLARTAFEVQEVRGILVMACLLVFHLLVFGYTTAFVCEQ